MNNYFTKKEDVTGKVSIWARASSQYQLENGASPFYYELQSGTVHWSGEATLVITHEVMLSVPEGIDLLAKTIETLEAKKKEVEATAYKQAMEIQKKIIDLLRLECLPPEVTGNTTGFEADLDPMDELQNCDPPIPDTKFVETLDHNRDPIEDDSFDNDSCEELTVAEQSAEEHSFHNYDDKSEEKPRVKRCDDDDFVPF